VPRHRIRDIAALSGLSAATVDRVLHDRSGVRAESTLAVRAAIAELERQQVKTEQGVRKLTLEAIVADHPVRTAAIRAALHEVRPQLQPRVVHTFVRTVPPDRPDLAAAALAQVRSRRPQGLLVDLDDDPAVVAEASLLMKAGIPVITTRRPFPRSASLGHSGLDDRAAGATAGYLLCRSLPLGAVRIVHTQPSNRAERDRIEAFSSVVVELRPSTATEPIPAGALACADLAQSGGVYLVGNGEDSRAGVVELRAGLPAGATVVAHRGADALSLLSSMTVEFVLDVNWDAVVREGCEAILRFHRHGPHRVIVTSAPPTVLTPFNVPV
jgi:LacI family transcriptional regulator